MAAEQRDSNSKRGAPTPWRPQLLKLEWEVPLSHDSRCPQVPLRPRHHHLGIVWGLGHNRTEKRKSGPFSPLPLSIKESPFCLLSQKWWLLLELSIQVWFSLSVFKLPWVQPGDTKGKKVRGADSLLVLWYFKFWSSFPIHLLSFIFQSPQIAALYALSSFYSGIQCESRGRANSLRHHAFTSLCKDSTQLCSTACKLMN